MPRARALQLALLAAVAFVYVRYYARPCPIGAALPKGVWAADCTPEVLREKRPVVLLDRAARPIDLLSTVFRGQFVQSRAPARRPAQEAAPSVARARFTLLSCEGPGDTVVELWHPRGAGAEPDAAVRLHHGQTLVLPPWWAARAAEGAALVEIPLWDPVLAVVRLVLTTRTHCP